MNTVQIGDENMEFVMHDFHLGKESAYRTIFDFLFKKVVYYAKSILDNEDEAEEVVVDSFLKLYKNSSKFNSFTKLKNYLFITVRNGCFDVMVREKRRGKNLSDYVSINSEIKSEISYEIIDFEQLNAEIIASLMEAIQKLPELSRTVITMRYLNGMAPQEIADLKSLSYQTVKNQTNVGINKLRSLLQESIPIKKVSL